jgi:hypothetical protein
MRKQRRRAGCLRMGGQFWSHRPDMGIGPFINPTEDAALRL